MTAAAGSVRDRLPAGCVPAARHWIGGTWVGARSGRSFETVNPTTGESLHAVAAGDAGDVDDAVAAASAAAGGWWEMDALERGRTLRRAAELIRANAARFGVLDTLEAGRPIRDTAERSANGAAALFDFYAGLTDKLRGFTQPMGPGYSAVTELEPYGVVGAIAPWNYPLSNAATKIAPAIACGNAIVLKPSELASLSTLLLADLLHEAGVPAGVVNVVTGIGAEAGAPLVEHAGVGKVSFTGSTATGRRIGEACGRLIRSVTLELGGKSANIVFPDADLRTAAKGAAFTVFNNSGQTCSAGTRLLVHRSVAAEFLDLVRAEVATLAIGDPMLPATRLGPVVSAQQLHRIERAVERGVAAGARAERPAVASWQPVRGGYFHAPVLLHDVDPASEVAQQEIFGPVLCVFSFESDDQALALANGTEYGLAASIWTRSLARYERARREIEAGLIWVNCPHALHPGTPVAAQKSSGLGSEYGMEAAGQYMKQKSTVSTWTDWTSGFEG
ncbi:MAG: aldehyde dehydrogenase [Rhizobiaceae bacterium]|nr:aldehyde dehydrogenase [Rhizobiaceae bacterium]